VQFIVLDRTAVVRDIEFGKHFLRDTFFSPIPKDATLTELHTYVHSANLSSRISHSRGRRHEPGTYTVFPCIVWTHYICYFPAVVGGYVVVIRHPPSRTAKSRDYKFTVFSEDI
jgi:hypothetical protein